MNFFFQIYNCTPKELVGTELCIELQYYNSSNTTWAPFYPLNGAAFGNITLLSLDSATVPCENCSYKPDDCCQYTRPPTHITTKISKNDWNDFTITVEGVMSYPKRVVTIDFWRSNDSMLDVVSTNMTWNVDDCSINRETPWINTSLQWRWDRVDINGWMRGYGSWFEIYSVGWLNRTHFLSQFVYWNYDNTTDVCVWRKPEDPCNVTMIGSLVNRTRGKFWFKSRCPLQLNNWLKSDLDYWLNASYSINQLMVDVNVNSSFLSEFFTKSEVNFGFPLPHPVDSG